MTDLALQSIVFNTDQAALRRTAWSVGRAVRSLRDRRPELGHIQWRLGDCSVEGAIDAPLLTLLTSAASAGAGADDALEVLLGPRPFAVVSPARE